MFNSGLALYLIMYVCYGLLLWACICVLFGLLVFNVVLVCLHLWAHYILQCLVVCGLLVNIGMLRFDFDFVSLWFVGGFICVWLWLILFCRFEFCLEFVAFEVACVWCFILLLGIYLVFVFFKLDRMCLHWCADGLI